jgi:hypothetical protein
VCADQRPLGSTDQAMRLRLMRVKFAILAEGAGFVLRNTERLERLRRRRRTSAAEAAFVLGDSTARLKACPDTNLFRANLRSRFSEGIQGARVSVQRTHPNLGHPAPGRVVFKRGAPYNCAYMEVVGNFSFHGEPIEIELSSPYILLIDPLAVDGLPQTYKQYSRFLEVRCRRGFENCRAACALGLLK